MIEMGYYTTNLRDITKSNIVNFPSVERIEIIPIRMSEWTIPAKASSGWTSPVKAEIRKDFSSAGENIPRLFRGNTGA